jgi:hypothetical protein
MSKKTCGDLLFFTGVKRKQPKPDKERVMRDRIDAEMLSSLATSFQMRANGYEFIVLFNDQDIADLLVRAAERAIS